MVDINPTMLIIILDINNLNAQIKRLSQYIKKQVPTMYCLRKTL